MAVRFHIDGYERPLAAEDALVLSHCLRAVSEHGLAEAVRAAATVLRGATSIRIDERGDARALVAAAEACRDLIGTPELKELRLAAERFLAGL